MGQVFRGLGIYIKCNEENKFAKIEFPLTCKQLQWTMLHVGTQSAPQIYKM